MGLGDFFRRRKERESVIPPSSSEVQPLGSFASAEGQPVIGQQVGGGQQGVPVDLSDLSGMFGGLQALSTLGPMIQQAVAEGNVKTNPDGSIEIEGANVTIEQGQTVDLTGGAGDGLRNEILEIMSQHGIDAEAGSGSQIDASAMPAMQQQILEALARHGIDPNASGSSFQFGSGEPEK
jgi:hypothetical protein